MAKSRSAAQGGKWWVVHQHEDVQVVQAEERPPSTVEKGERLKRVNGPYNTEEKARERAEMIEKMTLKYMASSGE